MKVEHPDIARQAFSATALPPPPRAVKDALGYITKLLSMLPPDEQAGYVKGPAGGENVSPLPDGTLVRVSRVMYPDGQIVKVMNDAPNGGPQWVFEDVRPQLYVPYTGGHTASDVDRPPAAAVAPPVDLAPLLQRIADLEQRAQQLHAAFAEISRQIGALNTQIADLSAKPGPALPDLPDYIGRLGPLTIISKPRT
jgi:hypothetical protein